MWINIDQPTADALNLLIAGQPRVNATLAQFSRDLDERQKEDNNPILEQYRAAAAEKWEREGSCEIDSGALVSIGDDPGAYVMAWVWVYDTEAGIKKDEEDNVTENL